MIPIMKGSSSATAGLDPEVQRETALLFHNALQGSSLLLRYQRVFLATHGLSLRLVEAGGQSAAEPCFANSFCGITAQDPVLSRLCNNVQCKLREKIGAAAAAQWVHCDAGFTKIGVPIIADGRHVSMLVAGCVLDHPPTEADFRRVKKLSNGSVSDYFLRKLYSSYHRTPIVQPRKMRSLLQYLELVAQHLAEHAGQVLEQAANGEPSLVKRMKNLAAKDIAALSSIRNIAQRLSTSPDHLERVYKKSTGARISAFVRLARVEKVKELLSRGETTVAAVAFQAGFGSVSQLNRTFKRFTGITPRQWRVTAAPAKERMPAPVRA